MWLTPVPPRQILPKSLSSWPHLGGRSAFPATSPALAAGRPSRRLSVHPGARYGVSDLRRRQAMTPYGRAGVVGAHRLRNPPAVSVPGGLGCSRASLDVPGRLTVETDRTQSSGVRFSRARGAGNSGGDEALKRRGLRRTNTAPSWDFGDVWDLGRRLWKVDQCRDRWRRLLKAPGGGSCHHYRH